VPLECRLPDYADTRRATPSHSRIVDKFSTVADRDPLTAKQCAAILRIPNKRAPKRTAVYLESDELLALMDQPDRKTKLGERDHVLLALIYNTGARVSEALQLRPREIRLDPPAQVYIYGKGRKERICPLWPETAELLATFLERHPTGSDEAVFRNRYGNPLGASGVRFRLKRYVQAATEKAPRLADKRVSPHTLSHYGCSSPDCFGRRRRHRPELDGACQRGHDQYLAQANLETKRKAIEKADGVLRPHVAPRWKKNADVLDWLDSL
jgi:integrase